MCGPAIPILIGISTAFSVGGAVLQSEASRKQAHAEKKQARYNALVKYKMAEDVKKRGQLKEQRLRSELRGEFAAQKTAFAKAGIKLGEGSPLDVLINTRDLGEIDLAIIRENVAREAEGLIAEGDQFRKRSKIAGKEESFARQGGVITSFATALGGATQIASLGTPPSTTRIAASGGR